MFHLKSIKLNNFRCFKVREFEFSDKVNIIYGNNAVGKTSLVESIYVLGCCKSHRTNEDDNLVKIGESYYSITANISNINGIDDEINIMYTQKGKKIALNNKIYKNMSEYIGFFKVILFCPEDITLIVGAPKDKRRFLDMSICFYDKKYMNTIILYKKVLKQRNEYLKLIENGINIDYVLLETYTNELVRLGEEIILTRRQFIGKLNETLNEKVMLISGSDEEAYVEYKPNCDEYNIEKAMKNNLKVDMLTKTTTCGPHKDTFTVIINKQDSSVFASQGQQKTLTLALKLALADVIKKVDSNIIIVLDDVFGELDQWRQNNILKLLETNNQIFITTTSIDSLTKEIIKNSNIINIEKEGN